MSKNSLSQEGDEVSTVYLGYIEDGDKISEELPGPSDESESSSSTQITPPNEAIAPWLVNKIGGAPIFPLSQPILAELESILNSITCRHCKSECVLIFQISSPIDDSPHARVIQVYTCVKVDCSRHSWFALRCLFKDKEQIAEPKEADRLDSERFKLSDHPIFGPLVICHSRAFFEPYYVSVIEEPTGRENFAWKNLDALRLASKYTDPDLKPAPIEEKYKNLKNYKPPQPPAHLSDLEDFEKFQLEKLYGNDKVTYRYYKRIGRYQAQVVRYDWEGSPLLNSSKTKLTIQPCSACSAKRKFEFQLMSALINYLSTDKDSFDKESIDFSSVLVHSCSKNCSLKTLNIEDTFFVPDTDSRVFNKIKQRLLALKLKTTDSDQVEGEEKSDVDSQQNSTILKPEQAKNGTPSKTKKKKKTKNKKKK